MSAENKVRALLAKADPVRTLPEPRPHRPAVALIQRAESGVDTIEPGTARRPDARSPRGLRLALATGLAAVAVAGAGLVMLPGSHPDPGSRSDRAAGTAQAPATSGEAQQVSVVKPLAYDTRADAPAARQQLSTLADKITAAPYDSHTGRYAYAHTKVWGDPTMTDPSGRYLMSWASERETWTAPDGSGGQRMMTLQAQYPDEASRAYWESQAKKPGQPRPGATPANPPGTLEAIGAVPGGLTPLPADRAGLAALLHADEGTGAVAKSLNSIYSSHAVSREQRAEILRIVAEVPGFVWRGTVTDRAGRTGVAISGDDRGGRDLLIFDAATGVLLAQEHTANEPQHRLSAYMVYLGFDRTDRVG